MIHPLYLVTWHIQVAGILPLHESAKHIMLARISSRKENRAIRVLESCGCVRPSQAIYILAVPCSKNKKTWVTARGARTGICRISLHGVWMKGHFPPCFFDFISGTPESRCFALKTVVSVQPSNHQALPSNKHGKKKTGTCIDLGHESCKLIFAVFLGSW